MEWLVGVLVVLGLVGVVVPVLPGLLLVATAIGVWAAANDVWWLLVLVVLLAAVSTTLKYAIPARTARDAASTAALAAGVVGAVVGFFVVPVVGVILGFPLGVLLAELVRLRDVGAAWRATSSTVKSIGVTIAVELAAGLAMTVAWAAALLA